MKVDEIYASPDKPVWSMSARLSLKFPQELWLKSASKVSSDHKNIT